MRSFGVDGEGRSPRAVCHDGALTDEDVWSSWMRKNSTDRTSTTSSQIGPAAACGRSNGEMSRIFENPPALLLKGMTWGEMIWSLVLAGQEIPARWFAKTNVLLGLWRVAAPGPPWREVDGRPGGDAPPVACCAAP